jgi:uncharacterized protein YdhG (YjbR/CyaY superfamily)
MRASMRTCKVSPDLLCRSPHGAARVQKHLSIFPFSPAAIDDVRERLDGFDVARGTIRFSPDRPAPATSSQTSSRARKREIATKR